MKISNSHCKTALERARDLARHFAERAKAEKDKSKEQVFYDRAEIKDLKVKIVEVMLDNDMDRARDLLKEEIEKAFQEKRGFSLSD